tara:strand:- start:617 stop:958 length:342 start_codon:yes stop_codon:yes gene_type:complete
LFEPGLRSGLGLSLEAVETMLFGATAAAICNLAIAVIGLYALSGRFEFLRGLHIIVGCFVLIGASAFAAALMSVAVGPSLQVQMAIDNEDSQPRREMQTSKDNPYARASVSEP